MAQKLRYTEEQRTGIKTILTGENAMIQAYAGTGKTFLLEHAAKACTQLEMETTGRLQEKLMVAFNVRAKTELEERMRGHDDWLVKTFNGLGYSVLWSNKGIWGGDTPFFIPDGRYDTKPKMELILDGVGQKLLSSGRMISEHDMHAKGRSGVATSFANGSVPNHDKMFEFLLATVNMCKVYGIKPSQFSLKDFIDTATDEDNSLRTLYEQIPFFEVLPMSTVDSLINEMLAISLNQARDLAIIDFADQIYLSVLYCPNKGRQYPKVFVDEVQDASDLNNRQIERAAKGQVVFVGDEFQTLYTFRGALPGNMKLMREQWKAKPLTLGVTFRCPTKVVERACKIINVTDYRAFEANKVGNVQVPFFNLARSKKSVGWSPAMIVKDHLARMRINPAHKTTILASKNTGCLAFLCMLLLDNGLVADKFALGDIGWSSNRISIDPNPMHQKPAEAIMAGILQMANIPLHTITEALVEPKVGQPNYNFVISTVHRYKGLEADDVYIFDPYEFASSTNLFYVAQTRTRNRLAFLDPARYAGECPKELLPLLENYQDGPAQSKSTLTEIVGDWAQDRNLLAPGSIDLAAKAAVERSLKAVSGARAGKMGSFWSYDHWLPTEAVGKKAL